MEKYSTPAELLVSSFQNPKFKDRICLVDTDTCRAFSYADMEEETALAAGLLRSFYINPGDTISLLLENGLHFFMPWIGAMRIGAKVHPINCLYTPEQVLYAVALCETKLLVTQERYVWDRKNDKPSQLLELLLKQFPKLRIVVMHDVERFENGKKRMGHGYPGTYSWDILKQFIQPYRHVVHRNLEDPFQLICTSGTTGKPKAVVQHNGMFEPNVRDIIKTYGLTERDRGLLINRLFHVNAQVTNFFPMTLLGGTTVICLPDPKKFLCTLGRWHITYSSVIPPFLKYVLVHPIPPPANRKKMRFLIVGADILSPELHKNFMQKTLIRVRPGWGMTETLCWGTGTALDDAITWGSIGRTFPHTDVKIVDPESNWEETTDGQWGRLIVKGQNVFEKYFRNKEATEKAFAPSARWGKGWFDTGDTCRITHKKGGILFFGWRASADSWKVRGEFVNGPSVDEFIKTNPAVDDAMAVPITLDGETETVLCVVLKPETSDILSFCEAGRLSGKLEKHIKIKSVIFVSTIELGDTGKKSRKKMAELAQKLVGSEKTLAP
ncbi:MAG: class I adenylate-forming enzyme family protein [bacterium]|nr:class I adenylate-forming enzyme family protein [bacterium]